MLCNRTSYPHTFCDENASACTCYVRSVSCNKVFLEGSVIMTHTLTIFSHQNDVLRFHSARQSELLFYTDTKVATSDRDILTTDVKLGF